MGRFTVRSPPPQMSASCTLFHLFNVLIAIALALVGAWSNMMFICIIAVNTLIGIVQELHAKKTGGKAFAFICTHRQGNP